ncbi:hypothetical protein ABER98_21305 [Domibacillus aminovorans]|uniref:hypothetical protein n=1 Tax=Domibacillus aminovorans TaxID=29332 RepID=UPI003D1D1E09
MKRLKVEFQTNAFGKSEERYCFLEVHKDFNVKVEDCQKRFLENAVAGVTGIDKKQVNILTVKIQENDLNQ